MYSNLTLYYLNQMGIRPWIKRSNPSTLLPESVAAKQESFKLLVFISANLTLKAQSLLQQMVAYINLPEHEMKMISVQESHSATDWQAEAPLAVLVLGQNTTQLNFNCPVLVNVDPDYLLNHPAEKKKIFKDLSYINQLMV